MYCLFLNLSAPENHTLVNYFAKMGKGQQSLLLLVQYTDEHQGPTSST